jgi:hypothetical protein
MGWRFRKRRIAAGVAAVLTSACAAAPAEEQVTTGQVMAQALCPHRIAEANAWINHMPGAGRAPRELHVDVRLVEATDTAVLLKSAASTGDNLILEVRTAPAAPVPGRLAYRQPVPDPLPKRITFFCRGGEIAAISHIEKVY